MVDNSSEKELEDLCKELEKGRGSILMRGITENCEKIFNSALRLAVGFYEVANYFGRNIYYGLIPPKLDVPPEVARSGMHEFCQILVELYQPLEEREYIKAKRAETTDILEQLGWDILMGWMGLPKETLSPSPDDKLNSLGNYYFCWKELKEQPHSILWKAALAYDQKGIIPAPHETLVDLVYRGNSLLFIHRFLKETVEPEIQIKMDKPLAEKVQVSISNLSYGSRRVNSEDLQEANAKIPYYMDLTWATAYVKDKRKFMAPALGITFTFPQYNGLNFMHMLPEYKSREQFLGVLAHEMVHMGTVHLDSRRDYLETKAYLVSKGDLMLGEYAVALNAQPRVWVSVLEQVLTAFGIPVPERFFKHIPKIKSGIEVMLRTHSYREVQQRLEAHYGARGGYILGRLNADEIEEFRDTNDIPGRIALKDDLKWRIMKENFAKLE